MTKYQIVTVTPEQVLKSPNYFLQQINQESGALNFIKTTRKIISSSAFVDGRSTLSVDNVIYAVDIKQGIAFMHEHSPNMPVNRYIFHMSFCGSTLLARACDKPEKTLSYKEPQALIDLAMLKVNKHMYFNNKAIWHSLVKLVSQQFQQSWHQNEVSIIKPSNWVNSLLPDLLKCHEQSNAIFLTISPKAFLIAVLRGGKNRITFTYNLLSHLIKANKEFALLVAGIEKSEIDIMDKIARFALVTHYIQTELFNRMLANSSTDQHATLTYEQLLNNPIESIKMVSNTLDLKLTDKEITENIAATFNVHAKDVSYQFCNEKSLEIDSQVENEFQAIIDPAMNWYKEQLLTPLSYANSA
jgi:hypothetical protein